MKAVAATSIIGVLGLVFGSMLFMMIVSGIRTTHPTAAPTATVEPSAEAINDMGPLIDDYRAAARTCPGVSWVTVAAVAKVETDHGRAAGPSAQSNSGTHAPPAGPFDEPGTSPHTIAAELCATQTVDLRSALFAQRPSWDYVETVLEWVVRYTGTASGTVIGDYSLPVPTSLTIATPSMLTRSHHDYPATDLPLPVGTPVFAMHDGIVAVAHPEAGRCGGTVIINSNDNATYTNCHLSQLNVTTSQMVTAGQQIGLSGGQPGTPGAGNTTGAHLHLSIRANGVIVCPQPILWAINTGQPINPHTAPSYGCITNQPGTDWLTFIAEASLDSARRADPAPS